MFLLWCLWLIFEISIGKFSTISAGFQIGNIELKSNQCLFLTTSIQIISTMKFMIRKEFFQINKNSLIMFKEFGMFMSLSFFQYNSK